MAGSPGCSSKQLIADVAWGPLDVLLLDLPPGTAEPHETVARQIKPTGVVLVTTPQEVAQIDTMRMLQFYMAAQVPVIGTILNMAYFQCPDCGARHTIWPRYETPDGPLTYPILAELPLIPAIAGAGDAGRPIVATEPESTAARAFFEAARRFWARMAEQHS